MIGEAIEDIIVDVTNALKQKRPHKIKQLNTNQIERVVRLRKLAEKYQ